MHPYVSIITLGVPDVETARRFYVDGLGWPVVMEVPGEVVFLRVGHGVALALWGAEDLAADIGPEHPGGRPVAGGDGPRHNVRATKEVGEVLAEAEAAGAPSWPPRAERLRRPPGLPPTRPATAGRSPTTHVLGGGGRVDHHLGCRVRQRSPCSPTAPRSSCGEPGDVRRRPMSPRRQPSRRGTAQVVTHRHVAGRFVAARRRPGRRRPESKDWNDGRFDGS